jgi:hypothetical protein
LGAFQIWVRESELDTDEHGLAQIFFNPCLSVKSVSHYQF